MVLVVPGIALVKAQNNIALRLETFSMANRA